MQKIYWYVNIFKMILRTKWIKVKNFSSSSTLWQNFKHLIFVLGDVLFDNKVLFAVSVFAILLVVVLIVSFIYGYVYRKKSKNRRKSEQEEDGGGGENVVAVAAENAEANTLYIKEGGTIEGAQSKIIF